VEFISQLSVFYYYYFFYFFFFRTLGSKRDGGRGRTIRGRAAGWWSGGSALGLA